MAELLVLVCAAKCVRGFSHKSPIEVIDISHYFLHVSGRRYYRRRENLGCF